MTDMNARKNISLLLLFALLPNIFGSLQFHACAIPFLHDCCSNETELSCCSSGASPIEHSPACPDCPSEHRESETAPLLLNAPGVCEYCVITLPSIDEGVVVEKASKKLVASSTVGIARAADRIPASANPNACSEQSPPGALASGIRTTVLRI